MPGKKIAVLPRFSQSVIHNLMDIVTAVLNIFFQTSSLDFFLVTAFLIEAHCILYDETVNRVWNNLLYHGFLSKILLNLGHYSAM